METNRMRRAIAVLLVVLFLVTMTASAVSAKYVYVSKTSVAVSPDTEKAPAIYGGGGPGSHGITESPSAVNSDYTVKNRNAASKTGEYD